MPDDRSRHRAPCRSAAGIGLAAVVVGALVVVRMPFDEAGPPPPDALRCGSPAAVSDCFVRIDGARFRMGAQATDADAPNHDRHAARDEGPVHWVRVTAFWIEKTEATVATYRRCVRAGACSEREVDAGGGLTTYHPVSEPDDAVRDALPVSALTWRGARDLCAWLGGRLPTEAEWELAARGTDGRRFAWGNQARCPLPSESRADARAHADDPEDCERDGPARADEGEELGPNRLIGAAGNLWEWTADVYAPDAYAHHEPRDPRGPMSGVLRTQRGGSFLSTRASGLRTTVRSGVEPTARLNDVGVRCAYGGAVP